MPELPYLFVYGSLRAAAGTEWSKKLTAASVFVGSGRTRGALFQLDSYVGMSANADDDAWVSGEVCRLHDPVTTLPVLDAYEGCGAGNPLPHEFERRIVTVVLENGQTVEAWAYTYALETKDKPRITSGNYFQPES